MTTTGDETGGDYSYDLAHEDLSSPATRSEPTASAETPESALTGTPEADGDYSYDLAHEVPHSGGSPPRPGAA
jgi:hypothetical protein